MSSLPPPLNISQLDSRLQDVASSLGVPVARARMMLCTLVVSQMLPGAVAIKGGMGVKLRLGERGTRATADLDVSTRARGEEFEGEFRSYLARGWGVVPASKGALRRDPDAPDRVAFTATLRPGRLHDPGLARPQYVMHPYRVSLSFLGDQWAGLDIEVSDPEIGPHAHARLEVDDELTELSALFGFGPLQPVELIDLEYQIAQKIHAVTDPSYARAHDLVDLQLLWNVGPSLSAVRKFATRTFDWRQAQAWPPLPLRPMGTWELAYGEARQETEIEGFTSVLPDIASARAWLEQTLRTIEATEAR
ncbi:nucleotidyl transferase AbiEii/AbiGii toxin family protein [Brachybacterium paraconglomeratum]|uniref:nucleotidyl transferase AbiEii/AbiGii toxin family protein n=1 Tax=Brachybacterium paraconglomeratum TaxID=173362 RepID=UPI0031E78423